jgi:hypothetical protein
LFHDQDPIYQNFGRYFSQFLTFARPRWKLFGRVIHMTRPAAGKQGFIPRQSRYLAKERKDLTEKGGAGVVLRSKKAIERSSAARQIS